MNPEEDIRLMKFAAGELGPDDEAALLLEAEREPVRWRSLALALVEERRIAAAVAAPGAADAPIRLTPAARRPAPRWLAAAAGLGLAFGAWLTHWASPATDAAEPLTRYVVVSDRPANPAPETPATAPVPRVMQPWFSAQDRAALNHHGYTLEEEPVLYVVNRDSGPPLSIPRKNIRLTRTHPQPAF